MPKEIRRDEVGNRVWINLSLTDYRQNNNLMKRRTAMKKFLVSLVLIVFAVPIVALADGAGDYQANCAGCHGAKTNLLPRMAQLMKVAPEKMALQISKMNKEEMIAITQKGKDKMPGFEKSLTKEQIGGIVDYIFTMKKRP
jgi:mono/diheme cytochrome c family protein